MKRYILIIIVLLAFKQSIAQSYCGEQINTSTTDWRSQSSINIWDWTQEFFKDIYLENDNNSPMQRTNIKSPFWAKHSSTSDNRSLFEFQKTNNVNEKDFWPEDGWELLTKSFGDSNVGVFYPFYALYNRYTGKVRAFLLVPNPFSSPQTGAYLEVNFKSTTRKTALFQHMKPIAPPVIDFNNSLNAEIQVEFANNHDYWLFAEFTVAYDPCTCVDIEENGNQTDSRILFNYVIIDESTINAKIPGVFTEKITDYKKHISGNPNYAFTNFINGNKTTVRAGQKGYKVWNGYQNNFEKLFRNNSDSMYRDRFWKSIDTVRHSFSEDFYLDLAQQIFINKSTVNIERDNFMDGSLLVGAYNMIVYDEKTGSLNNQHSNHKGVASSLPYVGMAIGNLDLFISGGGEKTSLAAKGPTVFEANLYMEGKVTEAFPFYSNEISTPGFSPNGSHSSVPSYNNILGVFNVLELPDFEYHEIKPLTIKDITADGLDLDLDNLCEQNNSDFNNYNGAKNVIFKQYKPKSNLQYVINPASEMEVVSVEAALVVEYEGKDNLFLEKPSQYNSTKAIPFYPSITIPSRRDIAYQWAWSVDNIVNIEPNFKHSGSPNLASGRYHNQNGELYAADGKLVAHLTQIDIAGSATANRIKSIEENTNLLLDYVNSNYPTHDSSIIRFRTDYLPATCFTEQSITLLGNNNIGTVFIKLYVVLKHKTNSNLKPVTMVLSYDISGKLLTATKANQEGSYNAQIWGRDYYVKNKCCFKCGSKFQIKTAEINNYFYAYNFNITSIPSHSLFFKKRPSAYNGEQTLTILGDLEIPNNSTIPQNSVISAAGKITFGDNISIGSGSTFYSGKEIDIGTNSIVPSVSFEIIPVNQIKYGCTNYDYQSALLDNSAIESYCKTNRYINKAMNPPIVEDYDMIDISKDYNINQPNSFTLFPNPNTGTFHIKFERELNNSAQLILYDITGRVLYSQTLDKGHTNFSIQTDNFADGIYFVTITQGDYKKTEKVMMQR